MYKIAPVVIFCYFTCHHAGLHQQLPKLWHDPSLCHFITFSGLYPMSKQLSDIYAQVSFINFRLLSSGTPLHTSPLQTLHFTDVLAAHGFRSWGNIDLRFVWVFPDVVVAVRVNGGCTNGNCGVLTDNASFVKQAWQMSIGEFTFHNKDLAERGNIYFTSLECIEAGFRVDLVGNGETASLLGKWLFLKTDGSGT